MKSILKTFIIVSLGLFIITVVSPDTVSPTVDKVLGFFIENKEDFLQNTFSEKTKRDILEPIKNSQSGILSYFKNDKNDPIGDLDNNNIVEFTNKERIEAGLSPLAINTKLTESAKIKINDMIANQYFEHTSPSGLSVSDLGKKVGYDYVIMGENLALGDFATDYALVQAWMASPGHRENILNKTYQEIGVYVGKGYYKNIEVWFAVQHFGTSRSVCPYIDSVLKYEIDQINIELKKRGDQINILRKELETNIYDDEEYISEVTKFNKLVGEYNQMLLISQQKIKEYNKQISAFNTCLSIYQ